jgi:hypothetical protein
MPGDMTTVFGVPVPSSDRAFLIAVHVHILAGIVCVVAGLVAMLSHKGRGRHSKAGTVYYWSLAVVAATAAGLSATHWARDYHLFLLGVLAFAAASVARTALRRRWHHWISLHITGMGLSYTVMLTAFYVDNGRRLPLWKELPQIAFWLLPGAVGLPLLLLALLRSRLTRRANPI